MLPWFPPWEPNWAKNTEVLTNCNHRSFYPKIKRTKLCWCDCWHLIRIKKCGLDRWILNSILLRRNCRSSWFTLLKRNHNNVKCSSLSLLSSERLESQNAFQIFYFLNFYLRHAERIFWYRYKPRQCKLWGQRKGWFDLEEPGKVLINVACEANKSSSS